jgi:hypothetical protein
MQGTFAPDAGLEVHVHVHAAKQRFRTVRVFLAVS